MKRREKKSVVKVILFLSFIFSVYGFSFVQKAAAQASSNGVSQLLNSVRGPQGVVGYPFVSKGATYKNGNLHSLIAPSGYYFPVAQTVTGNSTATAKNFITEHSAAFGITSGAVDFSIKKSKKRNGRNYERFGQTYSGIPVFGAEMLVQLNDAGGMVFSVSDIMTNTSLLDGGNVSTVPTISANGAGTSAITLMGQEHPGVQLTNTPAQLMIYQPKVVGNTGATRLVWQTVVKSVPVYLVDEMILLDAHTGEVALRFTQIKDALNRQVYDSVNTTSNPGTLERSEGGAASGIADVDSAYDFLGDTYDFYFNEHGRDSVDGAGMALSATVRYCKDPNFCPMQNAFWDGSRMFFGAGFATDDITAHELTHGVTQFESALIYLNESGAINESFSDMWGEWVDLSNTAGNDDPSVRWLMGEDVNNVGAIRDMADPPSFGDPDRRCSSLWFSGSSDNGGVHSNSGVGNKLCYLLTDGGTFMGVDITGMGISAAADIFYEVQTNLLMQGADYADLHSALTQAAINLGWSASNKYNLEKACLVTELSKCFDPNDVIDSLPPMPNSAGWWDIEPAATGLNTITMRVNAASDGSGVEYYFECIGEPNFDSGWQSSVLYDSNSYAPNTTYTFRVKARDLSVNQNESGWSASLSTTTSFGSDTLGPVADPARWQVKPVVIRLSPVPMIRMRAESAFDESGVEYFFTCVNDSNFSSSWQSSNMYLLTNPGLVSGSTYTFTVKVRDTAGNPATAESAMASVGLTISGAKVLTVPEPYATIQDAIDAAGSGAVNGDVIEVRPGTYTGAGNVDIDFGFKAITVRSTDPCDPAVVAATIINCGGSVTNSHRGFVFKSGEGANSVLSGFTITNGYIRAGGVDGVAPGDTGSAGGLSFGGGISCTNGSSPVILYCVISNCTADGSGGNGVSGAPQAMPVAISGGNGGSGASAWGGGIYCDGTSNPLIKGSTISGCSVISNGGNGGDGDANNTDPNNPTGVGGNGGNATASVYGGGIGLNSGSGAVIVDCIITNNQVVQPVAGTGGLSIPSGIAGTSGGVAFGGGAYYASGNAINMSRTSVNNNTSDNHGGGLYCAAGSSGTITDSYINGNTALKDFGGGIGSDAGSILTLNGCNIINNTSTNSNGGGIWFNWGGKLTLNNCNVNQNSAALSSGGGIYAGNVSNPSATEVDINDCNMNANTGLYGGGMYLVESNVTINNSTLNSNTAWDGGGIWGFDCNSTFTNNTFSNNLATGSSLGLGGGLVYYNGLSRINDCVFTGNNSDGSGGAMYFDGFSVTPHTLTNSLITDNQAQLEGAGLSNNMGAWVQVVNCTFSGNQALSGGAISSSEEWAWVEIFDSILWNNTATFGHEIAVGKASGSALNPTAFVDVYYSDVQGGENDVFMENGSTWVWFFAGNIDADPLFAVTSDIEKNDNYYLSYVTAGQNVNSPCVDAGDAASTFSTVGKATRTDHMDDSSIVDMGYHYDSSVAARQYLLDITVVDSGVGPFGTLKAFADGNDAFTIWDFNDPNERLVNQGTLVEFLAEPNSGWKVLQWNGTDNDFSTDVNNTVLMNSDKVVTIEFVPMNEFILRTSVDMSGEMGEILVNGTKQPMSLQPIGSVVTLTAVPGNPSHVAIWAGTDDDSTILPNNTVTMNGNRDVTVNFYSPKILYVGGDGNYTRVQDAIDDSNNGDIVEIAAGTYSTSWGYDVVGKAIIITSADPNNPAATIIVQDVGAGGSVRSAFRFTNVGRSTVLAGLTLRGFGVHVPAGKNGDRSKGHPDGWNGGSTWGGAIECWSSASPIIKNCVIEDSWIIGGNGGNGDTGTELEPFGGDGGWGGGAYGGGLMCTNNSNPLVINSTFQNCRAVSGNGGDGGDSEWGPGGRGGGWTYASNSGWRETTPWVEAYSITGNAVSGQYDYYTEYSGHGGAAYVGMDCAPEFVDCNFVNNKSGGGTNGVCGVYFFRAEPSIHYRTPNFGGAVYCADRSSAIFRGCNFVNNEADPNMLPDAVSSFVSYGGGVAFDDDANTVFEDCTFNSNRASFGGGMYYSWSDPEISDSNFVNNTALHGGGISFSGGTAVITGTSFSGNQATGFGGNGGAINSDGASVVITDSIVKNNISANSGGGIYVSNSDVANNATVLIKNCLIINNISAISGGGITAQEYSDPNILNCTIADNTVTGTGSGGGVYASQGNYTKIKDNILWGNAAVNGSQIAIGTATNPAWVEVKYSDVMGGRAGVYVEQGGTLDWDANSNIDANPLFVTGPLDDYYLSHADINDVLQGVDSPAIDAGSALARIVLPDYTTRTDGDFDRGIVDLGYHRAISQIDKCRRCDLVLDGIINFNDYAIVALEWLNQGCNAGNGWCGGADLTFDGNVDTEDLLYFMHCWLVVDGNPPAPNPAAWATAPYSSSTTAPFSISMTAANAIDSWGWPVEYFFKCVTCANDVNSGWISDPNWTDTGLDPNTEYGYQLRVRDVKPDPNVVASAVGGWSVIKYAITGSNTTPPSVGDTTAPSPDPMTWLVVPFQDTVTSVQMTATTASDVSGVEYYFEVNEVNGMDPNVIDSGWQAGSVYTATGLISGGIYNFRVKARDKSVNHNTTAWSSVATVNFGAAPLQAATISPDVPAQTGTAGSLWSHHMFADISGIGGDGSQVYIKFFSIDQAPSSSFWEPILATGTTTSNFGTITFANNIISYDVQVGDGAIFGYDLHWKVCVSYTPSDGSGELCSSTIYILPVP